MYKTFRAVGSVYVLDNRGQFIYAYEPQHNEPFFFNIGVKDFRIEGYAERSPKTLKYLVKIPSKNVPMPEKITITYTRNGDIASANLQTGELTLDEKFINQPIFMSDYAYLHELAHFLYPSRIFKGRLIRNKRNEFNCDKFAAKVMLAIGYNPSQILQAMKFVLNNGDEQDYRYKRMVNFLNSVKTKFV